MVLSTGADTALDMLRDADMAMYQAKEHGRDRHEMFNIALRREADDRLQLEQDLRVALNAGHLHAAYQPIVSLGTHTVTGVEALVRWNHITRGPITPVEFIPLAEETGLIGLIGVAVLNQACTQVAAHLVDHPDPTFRLAVNVSARQLGMPNLCGRVESALAASGLSAIHLQLELVETVLLDAGRTVLDDLKAVIDLGVSLAIDDFGTGYSSLSLLHTLPVSTIKIDRSFTSDMLTDPGCNRIVESTITLGHGLGLDIVAEGVERRDQAEALADMGCDYAQGFLWAPALPSVDDAAGVITALSVVAGGAVD